MPVRIELKVIHVRLVVSWCTYCVKVLHVEKPIINIIMNLNDIDNINSMLNLHLHKGY